MPSRLAHITTHFFSIPAVQDEPQYGTARPTQERTTSTALPAGAAASHRGSGCPLDAPRRVVSVRRGGGGGGGQLYSSAATGRPSSAASSTVALTPILSPTSPIAFRRPIFSVSPCSSGGRPRSWAALTRPRRPPEDSSLVFPSSPRMPAQSTWTEASGAEATTHSYPPVSTDSRPWLVSAGNGVAGREATSAAADVINARHPSQSTGTVSPQGTQSHATGPMSPKGRVLSNRAAPPPPPTPSAAVHHDRIRDGLSATASGRSGDSVGGRGGASPILNDSSTTLVTEADGEFLLQPLIHFVEDEGALCYVSRVMGRTRHDEVVASGADEIARGSATGVSGAQEKRGLGNTDQRDYVLHAQQSKSLHALMRSSSDAQCTTGRCRVLAPTFGSAPGAHGDVKSGVAGSDMGTSAKCLGCSSASPHASHLHSGNTEKGASIATLALGKKGNVFADSQASTAAATTTSLHHRASVSSHCDPSGLAGAHHAAAQHFMGMLRQSADTIGLRSSSEAKGTPWVSPDISKLNANGSEGHTAARADMAGTAMGSASPAIDVEGFLLLVRHNVFANYRIVPAHCAKRSYEQLPGRYRAGFDAIEAEVRVQQQQRDQQQGSSDTAANRSAEVTNGPGVKNAGGGGASERGGLASMGHPCSRISEGSSVGIAGAAPGASGYAADGYRDPLTFVGMSYYVAGSRGGALPITMSFSGSIGAASTATTPAASPCWLGSSGGIRREASVFPSSFSRPVEERAPAARATPASLVSSPTVQDAAVAATGPGVASLRSSSPTSAVTPTSAPMYDTAPEASVSSRVTLLQHVHHTIQAFIARGEREVALHFIMAAAPYRFPGISDGDRILAFFNQIRLFLPSPRFGIVMLAMEVWRSLYRPGVGAGAADCTHMTEELLALIEVYLCHGRTYAEYVSGLLMLRAVLTFAMENSTLDSSTAAVLLQHQSLLRSRLPNFLLAVWLILMEFYTIDDTVRPPRRVLRDLAANVMQDLFTVALELEMVLPVQNVVANAVNVFFAGPQPQPHPQLVPFTPTTTTFHHGGNAKAAMELDHGGRVEASSEQHRSDTDAAGTGAFAPSTSPHGTDTIARSAGANVVRLRLPTSQVAEDHTCSAGNTDAGEIRANLSRSPSPCNPSRLHGRTSPKMAANVTVMPARLSPDAATPQSTWAVPTTAPASASPTPQVPTVSHRHITRSLWGSVKRAARRLIDGRSMSSRSSVRDVLVTGNSARSVAKAPKEASCDASAKPSGPDVPERLALERRFAVNNRPSPPLLIDVLDDVFHESISNDPSQNADVVMRCAGTGPPPVPTFTGATGASRRWGVHSSDSHPSQDLLRVAVNPTGAGGGHSTMSPPIHGFRLPHASTSPMLRQGQWNHLRHQQRTLNLSAAATTTLVPESPSALSDALWASNPFDGAVLSRGTLWTLPLARALEVAGRPSSLEVAVAASTLTLGAFLCAWRVAGRSDETVCREGRCTETPKSTAPATTSEILHGAKVADCSLSPSGNTDPLAEGVILPLLSPETFVKGEGLAPAAARGDSFCDALPPLRPPPTAGSSMTLPHGVSSVRVFTGHTRVESNVSSLSMTPPLTAVVSRTEMPPPRTRLLASITTDLDPEWHSVEGAATNMYIPPLVSVTTPLVEALDAGAEVLGSVGMAVTPPVSSETATLIAVSPSLRSPKESSASVVQSAMDTAVVWRNGVDKTRASCVTASAVSPDPDFTAPSNDQADRSTSSPSGLPQGVVGLKTHHLASPAQDELPGALSPSSTESCGAQVPSSTRAGAAEVSNACLDFFLPSWVAARIVERCVHPRWDAVTTPTLSSLPERGNAAARPTSGLVVTKEVEALLTSVVPLLTLYYLGSLSPTTVTAATQVIVNCAIKAVKNLSQGVCARSSSDSTSHVRAPVGAKVHASSDAPLSSCAPRRSHADNPLNGAEALAALPCAASPADAAGATIEPCAAPFTSPLSACVEEDSALVDGTVLLNAILFIITVAEQYPDLYETIVRERLYPLLHSTLLLNSSAVEEPQLWLSVPLSSAGVAAFFSLGTRATRWKARESPNHQQQNSGSPASPINASTVEGDALLQRMRLFTSRTMYQRVVMPALALLSQNMPTNACAERCYPLVARLAQLGLRRPFSMASVTTALCICAVYPPLSSACQSKLIRAMAVVLSTPDDCLTNRDDSADDGDVSGPVATVSRDKAADGPGSSRHFRKTPAPMPPEEERRSSREEAVATKPARSSGGVTVTPKHPSVPTVTGAVSHGPLLCPSSRGTARRATAAATGSALYSMWRSQLNLQVFLPFVSTDPASLRSSTPRLRAAQRRQAAQTRLIKHQCFRAMSLFNSTWEGATLFFLEVCLPYFRHPDAQMRLECVQCCIHWLLSDCWHSAGQTHLLQQTCMPPVGPGVIGSASSTALAPLSGGVAAAVTRAPVRDLRTTANSERGAEGNGCKGIALQCSSTLAPSADIQAGRACVRPHASPEVAERLCGRSCAVFGMKASPAVSSATAPSPVLSIRTVQHHGCTHVNALREVVHHLVELAVCDPDPLVRKCALDSLSPETYPLLCPHELTVHQLFTVLWDSHMPNRRKAAQLLCELAPLNPSFIFPRLRQVLAQYTDDLASSIERPEALSARAKSTSAPLVTSGPSHIHEDALFVLCQVASRLKHSTHLYLPRLLSILSSVLCSASSTRGAVLQALRFLVALRDDSTEEQSMLFAPFFDLVAQQLIDDDGDTSRLLVTVEALQSLLRQFTGSSHSSPRSLPIVVECLHSLLYRKPSIRTEFAMAVLQLLGTISSIEPWDAEAAPRPPALLRRPQNRYALPLLSSLAGVLGRGRAERSRWLERDEKADSATQALAQLQKTDRFTPFMARTWCDVILRALMRTASEYVNGTMRQTRGGLCACLKAIMNILINTVAVYHVEIYLPTVLTLVIDLLEKRQTRSSYMETTCKMPVRKPRSRILTPAVGSTEGSKISDSAEEIRQLFLGSLLELVFVAGRRIGSIYPLLNVFLRRSWQTVGAHGLVQCCEVLDALCWAVPDLLRNDCDVWVSSLLEALMEYDTLVVTHRRAHEGAPGSDPISANAPMGAPASGGSAGVTAAPSGGREDGAAAAHNISKHSFAASERASPAQDEDITADAADNMSDAVENACSPSVPSPCASGADREAAASSWEHQLKLVYQALTLCLTSLQPLVSQTGKRLVAVSLSECLKSSHVPRSEAARRGVLTASTTAPTDGRGRYGGGLDGESGATLVGSTRSSLQNAKSPTGHPTPLAVFDLMADSHEELISFLNSCVCTPLLEYMVHCNLSTISMRLVKNLLSRLESLSAVHEEALLRLVGAMDLCSVVPQSHAEGNTVQSSLIGLASSSLTPPASGVYSLSGSARAQLELRLREVREQLYLQRSRQYHEGNEMAKAGGCPPGASLFNPVSHASSRSVKEALWFRDAAISRLWVQSTDSTSTVRRVFPFDEVKTSWETEGEMHLLGCLLVAAAWRHPPSTAAFTATLHTYFSHRFGPESVAVAYVRCVCSGYYNLCMPLGPSQDEQVSAQATPPPPVPPSPPPQQGVDPAGLYSDTATEGDTSPPAVGRSVTMSGSGIYDAALQAAQEMNTDVIPRNGSSLFPPALDVATPGERHTTAWRKGTGVGARSSGMGGRVVSWEDDTSAPAIVGGESGSVASSPPNITSAGASGARAPMRRAPLNSAAASPSSVLTSTATVRRISKSCMAFARPMAMCPSTERLDSSSDGRRSADLITAVRVSDNEEDQDCSGRMWTDSYYARLTRSSSSTALPYPLPSGYQHPYSHQFLQQGYPLLTRTAVSTPFCSPNSLTRTITATSTNGADTPPSTAQTHPGTTVTQPIPVVAGGNAGGENNSRGAVIGSDPDKYASASVPVALSGPHSASGSGTSIYPGSFFGDTFTVEGRTAGDGRRRIGNTSHRSHARPLHASLSGGGGGALADVEFPLRVGRDDAVHPAHASAGSTAEVVLTAPAGQYFRLDHPQPALGEQSPNNHPNNSGASPTAVRAQHPDAMLSMGTGAITASSLNSESLRRRPSLLGRPSLLTPASVDEGGAGDTAHRGPGGIHFRGRFSSIAASDSAYGVTSLSISTMLPSAGGVCAGTGAPSAGDGPHDIAAVRHPQLRKTNSPLFMETGLSPTGAILDTSVRGRSTTKASTHPPSTLPGRETRTDATVMAASSRIGYVGHGDPMGVYGGTGFATAAREEESEPPLAAAEADGDAPSPWVAAEVSQVCEIVASAHEAGGVSHGNALIAYFELHRSLEGHGWRSWWEQFCLFLLQCSQDYTIQTCEPFARQHNIAFAYSELLPLALLSTLPLCSVATLVAWLRALRDFYTYHRDPRVPVPQQVASGVACMAHGIRIYRHGFFPPEVVSRVVDVWLPDRFVADLANRSLNPPLRILYLEQELARSFSWGCTALLMAAADDVASAVERTLFVQDPRFQRWLCGLTAPVTETGATNTAAVDSAAPWHNSSKTPPLTTGVSESSPSLAKKVLPPSALELLGFHRAAALEYVRLWAEQQTCQRGDGGGSAAANEGAVSQSRPTSPFKGMRTSLCSSAVDSGLILGAMRCYICLYDFQAVLQLWDSVKRKDTLDVPPSMASSLAHGTARGAASVGMSNTANGRGGAQEAHPCGLDTDAARYVMMSAQALARWDYVQDVAHYAFGRDGDGQLNWTSSMPQAAQRQSPKSGETLSNPPGSPPFPGTTQLQVEDVEEAGYQRHFEEDIFLSNFGTNVRSTDAHWAMDQTHRSLLHWQSKVFVGAALVAAHDYVGARRALTSLRSGLRDSYAVFHTNNDRVKLEWSSIFQQLSELEEGIHALEQLPTNQEEVTSLPTGVEGFTGSVGRFGPGLPALDREINGKLFSELTVGRLRNIACRPVSATTTILQRFMIIAVRSAIAPVTWQLDNVLAVGEMLEKAGQPMRAVQVLYQYAHLPIVATSFTNAAVEFKQQLDLDVLRRLIRNLPCGGDLREVQACVQTALRHDLWLARRAATRRMTGASLTSSFTASIYGESPLSPPLKDESAMGGAAPLGALLTTEELGSSLSQYQVDLLLLLLACQRRLTEVRLHCTQPIAQRSPGTTVLVSDSEQSSMSDTAQLPTDALICPVNVDRSGQGAGADALENEGTFGTEPSSPISLSVTRELRGSPTMASFPFFPRGGSTLAAAKRNSGDRGSFCHNPTESRCVGKGDPAPMREQGVEGDRSASSMAEDVDARSDSSESLESSTGKTAMFAEYYLLEHAVAVTNYVPSVWREFGLLLFDVCLAIHAEWMSTGDDETKQNFLAQSAKAIHGLQLAGQLWRSRSESVFTRGIGPFPATTLRRTAHARTVIPSAHMILKALHLATMCELIVQEDARPFTSNVAAAATASGSAVGHSPQAFRPMSPPDPQASLLVAGNEIARGAGEGNVAAAAVLSTGANHDGGGEGDRETGNADVRVTSQSCDVSQCSEQPLAATRGSDSSEGAGVKNAADSPTAKFRTNPPARPSDSTMPSKPTTAVAVAEQQGGFACLDFSASSYVQWAAVAPFLLAAATRHRRIYTAVCDMCVQSRDMLRQLVFPLVAMFEHQYETMFEQRAFHSQHNRVTATEKAMTMTVASGPVSQPPPRSPSGSACEGRDGDRQRQRQEHSKASARAWEDESGAERVSSLSSSTATLALETLQPLGQQEEQGPNTSDISLIALRAATVSLTDTVDKRPGEKRSHFGSTLETRSRSTRSNTVDGEAAPPVVATEPYTVSASPHLGTPLEPPFGDLFRKMHSLLLTDVAAASSAHRRLIQEAMQLRGFVQGLWRIPSSVRQRRSHPERGIMKNDSDPSLAALDGTEGVSKGSWPRANAADQGGVAGFVDMDDATVMHGEMELCLDGFCPLPAPLWLLPSVFGAGMTSVDETVSSGRPTTGGDGAVRQGKPHLGGGGVVELDRAAGGRHRGSRPADSTTSSAAIVTRSTRHRAVRVATDCGEVPRQTPLSTGHLPSSGAAAEGQRALPGTATSVDSFARVAVPTIIHVRRYAVPNPAPHHRCEEVILLMLSDGLLCRFRHAAPASSTKAGKHPDERDTRQDAVRLADLRQSRLQRGTGASAGVDTIAFASDSVAAPCRYVMPCALMEQVASLLIGYIPLAHLQRPFVLPLSLEDYMTMMPDYGSTSPLLGAAIAATVRPTSSQGLRHGVEFVGDDSSRSAAAAHRTATQLLARSSHSTCAPPSLYHLMDDYTVHLRTREMALAAEEAVETYPSIDLDALHIAAVTGRRSGVTVDNTYPFNWTYGYAVSAPPSNKAAAALTNSSKYRNLVQRRRANEERYDKLVAAAYDEGRPAALISFLEGILATRPPAPSSTAATAAAAVSPTQTDPAQTATSACMSETMPADKFAFSQEPQPSRSPEETFALQQELYGYLATLPRTEAHLRSVLEALMGVVVEGVEKAAARETVAPPSRSPLHRTTSSLTSEKRCHGDPLVTTPTCATPLLSARALRACRLVLFRLESARFRLALSDAFNADSGNASHWFDARRTYAKELSEWSVVEYLFDIHTRECGTVLVNTYDGHVAVHALGQYCLQSSPLSSGGERSEEAVVGEADIASLTRTPFPTRDATLFRLTPVLVAGLPSQSPHAAFQYHAGSVLHEIMQYGRDLAGIATYGVDSLAAFAYHAAIPNTIQSSSHASSTDVPRSSWTCADISPVAGTDLGSGMPIRHTTLRPGGVGTCASGTAASVVLAGPSGVSSSPRASNQAVIPATKAVRKASTPTDFLTDVFKDAPCTSLSQTVNAAPGRKSVQRHRGSPLGRIVVTSAPPPPPRCFDASSLRLKVSYDALLVLHDEDQRNGRETMLRLLRSQRENMQREWWQMSAGKTPQNRDERNNVGLAEPATAQGIVTEESTSGHAASHSSGSADDNEGGSKDTPRSLSAFDLIASMIAAATDEENLLGVDHISPHTWRRWAPHW